MKYRAFIFEVSDEKRYEFVSQVDFQKGDLSDQTLAYEFLDKVEIPIIKFEQEKV